MLSPDHPLVSLSRWAARCFASFPEFTCSAEVRPSGLPERVLPPSGLNFEELQALFELFDREATNRLRIPSCWLDDRMPTSVIRNLDSPPGFDVDLTSPFVQRKELRCGERLVFLGDLHGSIHSLLRNLLRLRSSGILNDAWQVTSRQLYIVFLGDLVDRGAYGVEVWATVMRLFAASPDNTLLVRGNHEERRTWPEASFATEVSRKFPGKRDNILSEQLVYKMFTVFCERLPHAIFMACDPCDSEQEDSLDPKKDGKGGDVQGTQKEGGKGGYPQPEVPKSGGKGVPPPPPPIVPKSKALPKEDWRARAARMAEEAKPHNLVQKTPPLKSEWIQCCHGGIEPRFDPRPLLKTNKQFAVTGMGPSFDKGRHFEGLNWSDFTGVDHDATERFSSADPRGYHTGFLCDIPDTRFYADKVGIKAFFRGHQDIECCFKLVVQDSEEVVPWNRLLSGKEKHSATTLRQDGILLSRFLDAKDTVPVFTFSTCVEARCLPDEGFGVVAVAASLADWKLRACMYPVERIERRDDVWVDENWVNVHFAGWGCTKNLFFSRTYSRGKSKDEVMGAHEKTLSELPEASSLLGNRSSPPLANF